MATALPSPHPQAAYLYDPAIAARRARALRQALPGWADLAFAVKANGFAPVLTALAREVDGFEVSSVNELDAALAASAGSGRENGIVAGGPGKTPALLDALLAAGAGLINVESRLELERVATAARRAGHPAQIALRVNPNRVPLTGALRMGGAAGQFGIDESEVPELIASAARLPGVDLAGFHFHGVSGNLDAAAHVTYVEWCLEWSAATAAECGIDLRVVDVGGGLGFPFDGGPEFDLDVLRVGLAALRPPPGVRVVLEPGRWIAAPCAWYAAPVTDLKSSRGQWFAVLRGGIHHFALPASWDLLHRICVLPVDEWEAGSGRPELRDECVTVVGELCTPEDTLAHDLAVSRLRAGDVLVFPDAGAYGWEFALQEFLGHPPARRVVVGSIPTCEGDRQP